MKNKRLTFEEVFELSECEALNQNSDAFDAFDTLFEAWKAERVVLSDVYNALNALSFHLTIGTKLHHDQPFTPMSHEHIKHEVDSIMEMMTENDNKLNLMKWFDATMNQIEKDEYEIEERLMALQERKENAISKVWPEFDPLRYKLSSWSCEKSPIHMCAYDLLLEPNDPSWGDCIFCEQPEK